MSFSTPPPPPPYTLLRYFVFSSSCALELFLSHQSSCPSFPLESSGCLSLKTSPLGTAYLSLLYSKKSVPGFATSSYILLYIPFHDIFIKKLVSIHCPSLLAATYSSDLRFPSQPLGWNLYNKVKDDLTVTRFSGHVSVSHPWTLQHLRWLTAHSPQKTALPLSLRHPAVPSLSCLWPLPHCLLWCLFLCPPLTCHFPLVNWIPSCACHISDDPPHAPDKSPDPQLPSS